MSRIFDSFTFLNELNLLEIRLRHLYDHVDFFVIVEADRTHSGLLKPFVYEENAARFSWAAPKIIHVKAQFSPTKDRWELEVLQRHYITRGLIGHAKLDDVVLISDCDEIPSHKAVNSVRTLTGQTTFGFAQKACGWYVNWYDPSTSWVGTVATSMANINSDAILAGCPKYFRQNRFGFPRMPDGGCHFTFTGDLEDVSAKIGAFAHAEFDIPENRDLTNLARRRTLGMDPFGGMGEARGQFLDLDDPNFPPYLREHGDLYPKLFKKTPVQLASAIQGWMQIPELEWLAKTAENRHLIVEIGSWKGRSTKALAASTPGIVYAIDHWAGSKDERNTNHTEAVRLGPVGLYSVFEANLAEEIDAGKVIPIMADSAQAVSHLRGLLGDQKADMLFIDGGHDYEDIGRDITLYRPFLAEGGILCGHDYESGGPGVVRAVNELVPGFSRGAGSIWYR